MMMLKFHVQVKTVGVVVVACSDFVRPRILLSQCPCRNAHSPNAAHPPTENSKAANKMMPHTLRQMAFIWM
jgi:hypothetical protein